jgi:hypothetical protein
MSLEPNGNLWVHPDYNGGHLGLITLRDTYSHSTRSCMDNFLAGTWDDVTFRWLAVAFGGREQLRSAPIALTNFLEPIYPTNESERPSQDYIDSAVSYGSRIERLRPVAHLIVAGKFANELPIRVARAKSPQAILLSGYHPQFSLHNRIYRAELARMVQAFIAEIQRNS